MCKQWNKNSLISNLNWWTGLTSCLHSASLCSLSLLFPPRSVDSLHQHTRVCLSLWGHSLAERVPCSGGKKKPSFWPFPKQLTSQRSALWAEVWSHKPKQRQRMLLVFVPFVLLTSSDFAQDQREIKELYRNKLRESYSLFSIYCKRGCWVESQHHSLFCPVWCFSIPLLCFGCIQLVLTSTQKRSASPTVLDVLRRKCNRPLYITLHIPCGPRCPPLPCL